MSKRIPGVRYRIELGGIQDILSRTKDITDPAARLKLMKKAIRAAGAYLLKQIRRLLKKHDRTGWLRKSMKSKLKYYKKSGTLVLIVGVGSNLRTTAQLEKWLGKARKTVAANIVSHNYAHLLFEGHKAFTQTITYTTKRGKQVTMRRRIAAARGDNVIYQVAAMYGEDAKKRMGDVITQGLLQ